MDVRAVTEREREVLNLLGANLTHAEIGQRLFISVRTVESHVAALRRKLDIPDHRTLVRLAAEHRSETGGHGSAPPMPLTSFVGRAGDLQTLAVAMAGARLVTVTGPGGVGKTRLAIAAAAAQASRFGNGVRWVDLVPIATAADLEDAVAAACDATPTSRRSPAEAIVAAVRDQVTLLVLDNCEHLATAVAVLAERLLARCPGLRILLTSRVRLAVAFERVVALPGLPASDGVALFTERAAAAGADLAGAGPERVAAICAALGGLPLAIELAAVRLPALALSGVEAALVDQAGLLTGGGREVTRHRSITDLLDWSAALLTPDAARALRRLAVFVTPFGLDSAVAVAGFPPLAGEGMRSVLGELTDHNLVLVAGGAGEQAFRLLEPVRQYGIATMDAGDRQCFGRHLAWCRRSVRRLLAARGPGDARVRDEARAALGWAAGADPGPAAEFAAEFGLLLYASGRLAEAQARLEQAAGLAGEPALAVAALRRAAAVAKCRVRGRDALRLELAAADRARSGGDRQAAALALAGAAELLSRFPGMFGGQVGDGGPLLARARAMAPDDARVAAAAQAAEAGYAGPDGRPTADRAYRALAAARAAGDPLLASSALDTLAAALLFGLDVQGAHAVAQDRLAALQALDPAEPAVGLELKDALHVAAFCALGAGHIATAARMARGQHELPFLRESRDVADDELIAPSVLAGDLRAAAEAGERFLRDWNEDGRPAAAGRALTPAAVALAHGLLGDDAARQRWLAVTAGMRGVPVAEASRGTGYGELFEAMVLLHQGRPAEAFEVLTAAGDRGLYGAVFHQWTTALTAKAAVRAGRADAAGLVAAARTATAGNPAAAAILDELVRSASPAEPRRRPGRPG